MNFSKQNCIFFLLLLLNCQSYGQGSSDSLDYYFDDEAEKPIGALKINVSQIIYGDISFSYEQHIGNRIGLEVGLGYLLPYYISSLLTDKEDRIKLKDIKSGYSYFVSPKFYFEKNREFMYGGVRVRKRKFIQSANRTTTILECIPHVGGNYYLIDSKWFFEFNIGIGFSHIKTNYFINPDIPEKEYFQIVAPINLKIAYLIY
ncbi:hypothetical protein ACE193_15510 [Bernardetia sp. OM2101]|uniref:hypothetical protein n=1 Tax=Bernardetia sp. OM2101 TaxID=3344876 RepID=UPI0035D1366E